MRRRISQVLAAATGVVILLLAMLFAYVQQRRLAAAQTLPSHEATPTRAEEVAPIMADPQVDRGREVYRDQNCRICHSIDGVGGRYALDDVGTRLSDNLIRRWIVEPKSIDPKVAKPSYDHLSEEELQALVAYLATLRDDLRP